MQTFSEIAEEMRNHGLQLPPKKIQIQIENSREVLEECFKHFVKPFKWLPEYDLVSEWLTDNQGRGLFLYGLPGRGKSLLGRYILPAILLKYLRKVVSVYDMQEVNRNLDEVLKRHIIYLDDVGTEEISVNYGEKRCAFAEIMDAAEKHGKLLIISTNLNADAIRNKYGDRVLDRIRSVTKRISFVGESLRK
jgi:DNA replication protein DnaC